MKTNLRAIIGKQRVSSLAGGIIIFTIGWSLAVVIGDGKIHEVISLSVPGRNGQESLKAK